MNEASRSAFIMPEPGAWTFERSEIAQGFDEHVREQLPFYELATGAVAHIARHYVPHGGLVYDIGASTGNIGRAIEPILDERRATLIPIESSAAMCERYIGPQAGRLIQADALDVDYEPFDLAILFLVVMFMPRMRRRQFIDRLLTRLRPGGAIIILDKTEAGSGYPATVLWRLALAGKLAQGAEPAAIIAKELSLAGVQRPIRREELPAHAVEWFRFGDFAGWLIEAP